MLEQEDGDEDQRGQQRIQWNKHPYPQGGP
jgi:hypothetical protein